MQNARQAGARPLQQGYSVYLKSLDQQSRDYEG